MKALRKTILIVLVILVLGILAGGGYIGYHYLAYRPIKFSSEGWKQGDSVTRGRMLGDLRRSGILIGKTKRQVEDLLGPPNREMKDTAITLIDGEHRAPYVYSYRVTIGNEMIFHPIAEYSVILDLTFDENGICTETYVFD